MLHCHYPDANLLDHGTFTGTQLNCNIEVQSHFHSCFFGTLQHMLNFKGPIGSDPIVTATFIYTIESQFQKKLHFQYCLEHYFVNFCIVACANFGPT